MIGMMLMTFALAGCAHPLTIKNMSLYKGEFISSQAGDTSIGISSVTSTPEEERLLIATANALKKNGFKVSYPFYPTAEKVKNVDYVVKVAVSSEYRGSGWNFLINWPGFLVWAPAWHGYNYGAKYHFDVDLSRSGGEESLPRLSVPIDLDIRHAAMNRTWTELSWLEFSAIAFVGGILFTRYDHSVTPALVDKVEIKIGDYVASKISSAVIADKS